jgi:Tfp pilus assembly protein PilE
MEMIVVIVIITTLSMIAWPTYNKARQKAENKEAFSLLFLLQAAQKNYKVEEGSFYTSADIPSINSNLDVHLSLNELRHWNCAVYSSGCVEVSRKNDDTRLWHLNITEYTPVAGACS